MRTNGMMNDETKHWTDMTALTRKELAASAGISTRTLQRWLEPHRNTLRALGMMPNKKLLPPQVVGWICERFCIDVWGFLLRICRILRIIYAEEDTLLINHHIAQQFRIIRKIRRRKRNPWKRRTDADWHGQMQTTGSGNVVPLQYEEWRILSAPRDLPLMNV